MFTSVSEGFYRGLKALGLSTRALLGDEGFRVWLVLWVIRISAFGVLRLRDSSCAMSVVAYADIPGAGR